MLDSITHPGPPRVRRARRVIRAGAAPHRRSERRRQDEPARGDRAARLGPLAPDEHRRRARPLGRRPRPGRGPRRARDDRGRARPVCGGTGCRASERELRGWIASQSRERGPQADPGQRRRPAGGRADRASSGRSCSRRRRCSSSSARRVSAGPRSTSSRRSARRPTCATSRRTPGRSSSGTACSGRSARSRPIARELRFWDGTFLDAGSGDRRGPAAPPRRTSRRRWLAAHAEIAPDEAAASRPRDPLRDERPGTPRRVAAGRTRPAARRDGGEGGLERFDARSGRTATTSSSSSTGATSSGFASRGQQRTAILAFKLAELDLLTAQDGRPPLLLLDDVFSELDPERRAHLVRRIAELPQAFVTTTTLADLDSVARGRGDDLGGGPRRRRGGARLAPGSGRASVTGSRRRPMTRIGDLLPDAARGLGLEDELRLSRAMATFEAIVAERVPAAAGACRVLRIEGSTSSSRPTRRSSPRSSGCGATELLDGVCRLAGRHRRARSPGPRPARRSPAYNPAHLPAASSRAEISIEPGSTARRPAPPYRPPATADHTETCMAVRLQMKLGVIAEPDRVIDSPDTVVVVEPSVGSVARSKGNLYLIVTSTVASQRAAGGDAARRRDDPERVLLRRVGRDPGLHREGHHASANKRLGPPARPARRCTATA